MAAEGVIPHIVLEKEFDRVLMEETCLLYTSMTVMFLHMWAVIGRSEESVDYEAYFPHRYHEGEFESDGFVQPFCCLLYTSVSVIRKVSEP